jgi:hypothetical protein
MPAGMKTGIDLMKDEHELKGVPGRRRPYAVPW